MHRRTCTGRNETVKWDGFVMHDFQKPIARRNEANKERDEIIKKE